VELFNQWAGKATNGVLQGSLIDDFWKGLQERVGAHDLGNYKKKLAV
jgi:hypothetical protein